MSSFIGHGLAAVTTYAAAAPSRRPFQSRLGTCAWLIWLIVIAWMPDIDHMIPALKMSQHEGLRITHSLVFSLLLPTLSAIALYLSGLPRRHLYTCLWQSAIAGLSHPIMDWLVGVIGLPLFWPIHSAILYSPIGLLPSAVTPRWDNYYFYENLFIELGILLPLMALLLGTLSWKKKRLNFWQMASLTAVLGYFLHWSMGLTR